MWKLSLINNPNAKKPEELNVPEMPEELAYLWRYYVEIQSGEALTFTEIRNWSELTARHVNPREVLVLKRLDDLAQIARNEHTLNRPKDNGHNRTPGDKSGRGGRGKGR